MTKEFYGTYCKDKNELPFVTLSGSVFLSGYHKPRWLILLLGCKNISQFIVLLVKKYAFILFVISNHQQNQSTISLRKYSKASRYMALRYMASRSVDLGDTPFLIGSQNTWDTGFGAKNLEEARFLIWFQYTDYLVPWLKPSISKSYNGLKAYQFFYFTTHCNQDKRLEKPSTRLWMTRNSGLYALLHLKNRINHRKITDAQ